MIGQYFNEQQFSKRVEHIQPYTLDSSKQSNIFPKIPFNQRQSSSKWLFTLFKSLFSFTKNGTQRIHLYLNSSLYQVFGMPNTFNSVEKLRDRTRPCRTNIFQNVLNGGHTVVLPNPSSLVQKQPYYTKKAQYRLLSYRLQFTKYSFTYLGFSYSFIH